jgi:hypothetical protein
MVLAISITITVTGAVYRLLITSQRLTWLQGEQIALQRNLRAGAVVLREELGELSAAEGGTTEQNDIIAAGPTAVTYRAMRGMGFICQVSGPTSLRIARNSFSGHRDPQPGRDMAFVLYPAEDEAVQTEFWIPMTIQNVGVAAPCPNGQGPGITLTLSGSAPAGNPAPGTPIRITELMELRLYRSESRSWLGARSVSTGEAIQPLLGPLLDTGGFQLEYLGWAGIPTHDPTRIKSIVGTLRGRVGSGMIGREGPVEQMTTQVTLRNSSQP